MAKLTDREFVERAVVAGHIGEPQGEECLDIARRGKDKGSHIPVAEVLVQRGYLTEAEARSVRYGGRILTLQCSACGNQCRVRARASKDARQCPKCGGELVEDSGEASEPSTPTPQADASSEGGRDGTPSEAPTPAASHSAAASPHSPRPAPSKGMLPELTHESARLLDLCVDLCLSKWALTLVLTAMYALVLRGLFWLIGVR